MSKLFSFKLFGAFAAGLATFGLFVAVRASAAGVPEADGMTYTGYLESAEGTPLTGEHSIAVQFWASEEVADDLCTGKLDAAELQSGRFQVPLPVSCSDAVKANPDVWVSVDVDGASLGRIKLGAVPFAIEAGHATTADVASAATGELQAALDSAAETSQYVADRLGPAPDSAVDARWGLLHAAAVGACLTMTPTVSGTPGGVYVQDINKTCTAQCAEKVTGTCRGVVMLAGLTATRGTPGSLIGENYVYSCDNAIAANRENTGQSPESAGFSYCCCGDP